MITPGETTCGLTGLPFVFVGESYHFGISYFECNPFCIDCVLNFYLRVTFC